MNPDTTARVHLINPLSNPFGGSEQRTLAYYRELSAIVPVDIWSESTPSPELTARVPVQRISTQSYPVDGTLMFVGCYFGVGDWLRFSCPDRVIVVVNTPDLEDVREFIERLRTQGVEHPDLAYASHWLKRELGLPGIVDMSPIDLERFKAAPARQHERFRIGRLSRDVVGKHHPDDAALYQAVASSQISVRLMGASSAYRLARVKAPTYVEVIREGAEPAEKFLNSLDCFVYRTHPAWTEPHGRVVTEAMACELPVVCDARGGFTEFIEHGVNGFIFSGNAEALEIIHYLRHRPDACQRIGRLARQTIVDLLNARGGFPEYCCRVASI